MVQQLGTGAAGVFQQTMTLGRELVAGFRGFEPVDVAHATHLIALAASVDE
jgi:hypothetical protein